MQGRLYVSLVARSAEKYDATVINLNKIFKRFPHFSF
jgi:hypothetical protein